LNFSDHEKDQLFRDNSLIPTYLTDTMRDLGLDEDENERVVDIIG
jgi:hypothetical protein